MVSMDFLDRIELDLSSKRSRNLRSWYLYEQYRALERSQREAAQQLSDKTSQERLLHREVSEHRRRRQLCGDCRSEPGGDHARRGSLSCATCSIKSLYDSFYEDELNENASSLLNHDQLDKELFTITATLKSLGPCSGSKESACVDEMAVPELIFDDPAFLLAASSGNLADDIKEGLEYARRSIDDIHQHEMKEVEQCLDFKLPEFVYAENVVKLEKPPDDEISKYAADVEDTYDDGDSVISKRSPSLSDKSESSVAYTNTIFALWDKIVSFAHQVVQLNHGNCYYDYSSQFLTAVLAFDIIRRGISRMCNVLQPYVSPIKFVSSRVRTNSSNVEIKKETSNQNSPPKKTKCKQGSGDQNQKKCPQSVILNETYFKPTQRGENTCRSKNVWRHYSSDNSRTKVHMLNEKRRKTIPTHHSVTLPNEKHSSTIWSAEKPASDSCRSRVTNPMLELAKYIDSVIQDTHL